MAETTPVTTVTKKPLNFAVGLLLGGLTAFVIAFAIAKGWKKGKN